MSYILHNLRKGKDIMRKIIGIHKDFDRLGRLVIPKELRDLFGFEKTVEVLATKDGVLIRNPRYVLVERKTDDLPENVE